MIFCTHCGGQNTADSNFCEACGTELKRAAVAPGGVSIARVPAKRRKKVLWIGFGTLVLAVAGVGAAYWQFAGVGGGSERYFQTLLDEGSAAHPRPSTSCLSDLPYGADRVQITVPHPKQDWMDYLAASGLYVHENDAIAQGSGRRVATYALTEYGKRFVVDRRLCPFDRLGEKVERLVRPAKPAHPEWVGVWFGHVYVRDSAWTKGEIVDQATNGRMKPGETSSFKVYVKANGGWVPNRDPALQKLAFQESNAQPRASSAAETAPSVIDRFFGLFSRGGPREAPAAKASDQGILGRLMSTGGKQAVIGKWYRVSDLQVEKSAELHYIELFKDNTLLFHNPKDRDIKDVPGTWTDLEDGRIKMQLTVLGIPLIMMGQFGDEQMVVEQDQRKEGYVNGLEKARDYAFNRAPPTATKVMALLDQVYKDNKSDLEVENISLVLRAGPDAEVGSNCKDYTAIVKYDSSNTTGNPLAKGLYGGVKRHAVGFMCIDRDKKEMFKVTQRTLSCTQTDWSGRSRMGGAEIRETPCDY